MFKIDKHEIRYIIASGLFAIFWFFIALPYLSRTIDGSVFGEFLIFNIGLYAFFFIFLKSTITKTATNLVTTLGVILLFLAVDCWLPEYHVTTAGVLIQGANLGASSTDYLFGTIAQSIGLNFSILGISFIYIFTYLIFPIILLIASGYLLKDFTKHL